MKYIERYPHLVHRYRVSTQHDPLRYPNFEIICLVLEESFADLFDLKLLNRIAGEGGIAGYLYFFDQLMETLEGSVDFSLYNKTHLIKKIYQSLNSGAARRAITSKLLTIPPSAGTPQIAFVEKLLRDELKFIEPLSYIDMLRALNGLILVSTPRSVWPSFQIIHLRALPLFRAEAAAALATSATAPAVRSIYLVDMNLDPGKAALWAVLTMGDAVGIFSEVPLDEAQKSLVESVLGQTIHYEHRRSRSRELTGYAALAWLDVTLLHIWNFDLNASFPLLMQSFCFVLFAGDNSRSLNYEYCFSGEDGVMAEREHEAPSFKRLSAALMLEQRVSDHAVTLKANSITPTGVRPGRLMQILSTVALSGQLFRWQRGEEHLEFGASTQPGALGAMIQKAAELAESLAAGGLSSPIGLGPAAPPPTAKHERLPTPADPPASSNLGRILGAWSTSSGPLPPPPRPAAPIGVVTLTGSSLITPPNAVLGAWAGQGRLAATTPVPPTGGVTLSLGTPPTASSLVPSNPWLSGGTPMPAAGAGAGVTAAVPLAPTLLDISHVNTSYLFGCSICPPGFAVTLAAQNSQAEGLAYLSETSSSARSCSRLSITSINPAALLEKHKALALTWNFEKLPEAIGFIKARYHSSTENALAIIMLTTLISVKAKKTQLEVRLPTEFELPLETQHLVIRLLHDNAYLQEWIINSEHSGLAHIKSALTPIMARNRLLALTDYHPALMDDYWRQAVYNWLLFLREDYATQPLATQRLFERAVTEMGLTGLRQLLLYCADSANAAILSQLALGSSQRFYLSCAPSEAQSYLSLLQQHLSARHYFPFKTLIIDCTDWSLSDGFLANFVRFINASQEFNGLIFHNLTKTTEAQIFVSQLLEQALAPDFVLTIEVPSLEHDKLNSSPLQSSYHLLCDLVIKNKSSITASRRLTAIAKVSTVLTSPSSRAELSWVVPESAPKLSAVLTPGVASPVSAAPLDHPTALPEIEDGFSIPIEKDGDVLLEMQQQQNMQQQRQVKQQQQRVLVAHDEVALVEELVDYHSIEERLSPYQRELVAQGTAMHSSALSHRKEGATWLQNAFMTWIGAYKTQGAPALITAMTLQAAQVLLRNHRQLVGGLQLENLPRGFFTQRSREEKLVLCYRADFDNSAQFTPLTLRLGADVPRAKHWGGDFRQFNPRLYVRAERLTQAISDNDWKTILVFAYLQPPAPREESAQQYEEFCTAHPELIMLLRDQKELIIENWPVFIEAYRFRQQSGIDYFCAKLEHREEFHLGLRDHELTTLLLGLDSPSETGDIEALAGFFTDLIADHLLLVALAQVYRHWGSPGVFALSTKLKEIRDTLGERFFHFFITNLNPPSLAPLDFNALMNESFFITVDKMIKRLKSDEVLREAWIVLYNKQSASLGYENPVVLWEGFEYFVQQLSEMGLELSEHPFEFFIGTHASPLQVLVYLDRVLDCLKQLPELASQQQFLKQLKHFDLTNEGVFYALKYEKFKRVEPALELTPHGKRGGPPYAPRPAELYQWRDFSLLPLGTELGERKADALLKIRRLLATSSLNHATYQSLVERLCHPSESDFNTEFILTYLMHTQYENRDMLAISDRLNNEWSYEARAILARHIHTAVYVHAQPYLNINLLAIEAAIHWTYLPRQMRLGSAKNALLSLGESLLARYPLGTVLEAVTILYEKKQLHELSVCFDFLARFSKAMETVVLSTQQSQWVNALVKLAVLFSLSELDSFKALVTALLAQPLIVQEQFNLLAEHLLSINYAQSLKESGSKPVADFSQASHLAILSATLRALIASPQQGDTIRAELIMSYKRKGFVFGKSAHGDFRVLNPHDPEDRPELSFFVDHKRRLFKFFQQHLAISTSPGTHAKKEFMPLISFLKVLHASNTYLNEVEPFLALFEDTPPDRYWSTSYFSAVLQSLKPLSETETFPFSILKRIMKEPLIQAKALDELSADFPRELSVFFQKTISDPTYNSEQKALLCQLAVREFARHHHHLPLTLSAKALLEKPTFAHSRQLILSSLLACSSNTALQEQLQNAERLCQLTPAGAEIARAWPQVLALWLNAMNQQDSIRQGFKLIFDQNATPQRTALILHILAWSVLAQESKTQFQDPRLWERKIPKVITRLSSLSLGEPELQALAECYPAKPSPSIDAIRRLLKPDHEHAGDFKKQLSRLLTKPHPRARADYGDVAATRRLDLERLFKELRISGALAQSPIEAEHEKQIRRIFFLLKQLENGIEKLVLPASAPQAIIELSPIELRAAFQALAAQQQTSAFDEKIVSQLWGVLFEAIARTTGKYPHLAQQFALIANDVCCATAPTRLLQLATGEGKSHFVALRAARQVAAAKVVDICTAKRSLGERDLEDYRDFFAYLNIRAVYVDSKTSLAAYEDCQVHYTTVGEFSLFLDEMSARATPLALDPKKRIALVDEFDDAWYVEGRKTYYNYAKLSGKTPKQMHGFYKTVNEFYLTHAARFKTPGYHLSKNDLVLFRAELQKLAEAHEEKTALIHSYISQPVRLAQLLQSAHQTHKLVLGRDYTIAAKELLIADACYEVSEIVPLSSSNQKMEDSSFSAGVHQLLAVHLNSEAEKEDKPQNYHIHPESEIVSSQIAAERLSSVWGEWEGFSGTISAQQAALLYQESKAMVLHAPTNWPSLRQWHPLQFYDKTRDRLEAMAQQMQHCLEHNKSILFCCKDDNEVEALYADFGVLRAEGRLSDEHFAAIMTYTNKSPHSPKTILALKATREGWKDGKKQRGICLLASCFGRGDNAGVETVFLIGADDHNDLLQKGGRTARNGEAGEVFQFYLAQEWLEEEQHIQDYLTKIGIGVKELYAGLGFNSESTAAAGAASSLSATSLTACHERVMRLREYTFNLSQHENQAYRRLVARFSSWAMTALSQISEIALREELARHYRHCLAVLDDEWTRLSMKELSSSAKIAAIHAKAQAETSTLLAKYRTHWPASLSFKLPTVQPLIDLAKGAATETHSSLVLTSLRDRVKTLLLDSLNQPEVLPQAQNAELRTLFETATAKADHKSLRLFTQWEYWAADLSPSDRHEFFIQFCRVLALYQDGENHDIFVRFVDKTTLYWNKDYVSTASGPSRRALRRLWSQLASCSGDNLKSLQPSWMWLLNVEGKAWFTLLNLNLSLLQKVNSAAASPPDFFLKCSQQGKAFWDLLSAEPAQKKSHQLKRYQHALDGIIIFVGLAQRPADFESFIRIINNPHLFKLLTQLCLNHENSLRAYPFVLRLILNLLETSTEASAEEMSRIQLCAELLIKLAPNQSACERISLILDDAARKGFFSLLINELFEGYQAYLDRNAAELVEPQHASFSFIEILIAINSTLTGSKLELLADFLLKKNAFGLFDDPTTGTKVKQYFLTAAECAAFSTASEESLKAALVSCALCKSDRIDLLSIVLRLISVFSGEQVSSLASFLFDDKTQAFKNFTAFSVFAALLLGEAKTIKDKMPLASFKFFIGHCFEFLSLLKANSNSKEIKVFFETLLNDHLLEDTQVRDNLDHPYWKLWGTLIDVAKFAVSQFTQSPAFAATKITSCLRLFIGKSDSILATAQRLADFFNAEKAQLIQSHHLCNELIFRPLNFIANSSEKFEVVHLQYNNALLKIWSQESYFIHFRKHSLERELGDLRSLIYQSGYQAYARLTQLMKKIMSVKNSVYREFLFKIFADHYSFFRDHYTFFESFCELSKDKAAQEEQIAGLMPSLLIGASAREIPQAVAVPLLGHYLLHFFPEPSSVLERHTILQSGIRIFATRRPRITASGAAAHTSDALEKTEDLRNRLQRCYNGTALTASTEAETLQPAVKRIVLSLLLEVLNGTRSSEDLAANPVVRFACAFDAELKTFYTELGIAPETEAVVCLASP